MAKASENILAEARAIAGPLVAEAAVLRKRAVGAAAAWRWGNEEMVQPGPAVLDPFKRPKFKWLKNGASESPPNAVLHGLDAAGEVLLMRRVPDSFDQTAADETLVERTKDRIVLIGYEAAFKGPHVEQRLKGMGPASATVYAMKGERPLWRASTGERPTTTVYSYDKAGLLTGAVFSSTPNGGRAERRYTLTYRGGVLAEIVNEYWMVDEGRIVERRVKKVK